MYSSESFVNDIKIMFNFDKTTTEDVSDYDVFSKTTYDLKISICKLPHLGFPCDINGGYKDKCL